MWVVAFDISAEDKASFNRRKRLFYYHLARLDATFLSKSVLLVRERGPVEELFRRVGGIKAVWILAEEVEEVSY